MEEPYSITAKELFELGKNNIPKEFQKDTHLILNSFATLDFNSPGAEGFGVKRAGLSVPGSIMLLVSPGCCGRNTSAIGQGFGDRFAYLNLDENDIVTGKHLSKIPQAADIFVKSQKNTPTVLMICITCVDALLGTDMERVCKKVEEKINIPCRPCYMYALTRESHRPPMVYVRETVYSLLKSAKKQANAANLLGFFSPLNDNAEIYTLLKEAGLSHIRELSRTQTMEEYCELSKANFNLVLNPEARAAAKFFHDKLKIPSIEITRFYQTDKIQKQYVLLGNAIGVEFDDEKYFDEAKTTIEEFVKKHPDTILSIGSRTNANPFELALAMSRYGLLVKEIFAEPTENDFHYIKSLAQISPDTRIMSRLSPTVLNYDEDKTVNFVIGKDAAYYHPKTPCVYYDDENQPFGYQGVRDLFIEMEKAIKL